MLDLTVVMPAYNEGDGIGGFLREIVAGFGPAIEVVVVNDASTDDTSAVVTGLGLPQVRLIEAPANRGHGPTTRQALEAGLAGRRELVLAVDGDGQFEVAEMVRLVEVFRALQVDVAEGVRRERNDPLFRRLTSIGTRLLVGLRCGQLPADANTPLRLYRHGVLADLIAGLPADAMTPNLLISALTRCRGLRVLEFPVSARDRRGTGVVGSSWRQHRRWLPSWSFIRFCARAVRQWTTTRLR